jgi:hypothetical protein
LGIGNDPGTLQSKLSKLGGRPDDLPCVLAVTKQLKVYYIWSSLSTTWRALNNFIPLWGRLQLEMFSHQQNGIYYSIVNYKFVLRIIYHHLHAAFIMGTITINCPTHIDLWGYRIYPILIQQSVYFQFSRL